jgi:hypothetical protein
VLGEAKRTGSHFAFERPGPEAKVYGPPMSVKLSRTGQDIEYRALTMVYTRSVTTSTSLYVLVNTIYINFLYRTVYLPTSHKDRRNTQPVVKYLGARQKKREKEEEKRD